MQENPFATAAALGNSNLHQAKDGTLKPVTGAEGGDAFVSRVNSTLSQMISMPDYPCLGAKAALHGSACYFAVYDYLGAPESTAGLCRDLCAFAASQSKSESDYATFIAVFKGPRCLNESEFEQGLWGQLRALDQAQSPHFEWDSHVSSDPADPHFSFSFAGRAFYVIGMHEQSSRRARQFPWPTLVFNPHEQFERLRHDGKWKRMQETIREREIALQGNINPMLSVFGEKSEARQYSGRVVEPEWQAPFSAQASEPARKCPFSR
jgi:FPC/CPF motif-containing protein YcgG